MILGSQYAGEMKKGVFTIMHYLMPKRGILSLHSGCNVGKDNDVSLFFGLSGEWPLRSLSLSSFGALATLSGISVEHSGDRYPPTRCNLAT